MKFKSKILCLLLVFVLLFSLSAVAENEIADILISNESDDYGPIEYYGENISKEYGEHISYTLYSNESIDK